MQTARRDTALDPLLLYVDLKTGNIDKHSRLLEVRMAIGICNPLAHIPKALVLRRYTSIEQQGTL